MTCYEEESKERDDGIHPEAALASHGALQKKVIEDINFYYFSLLLNSPASYHPHLQHIGEGEGGEEGEDARPAHRQPVSVAPGESFELCNFS